MRVLIAEDTPILQEVVSEYMDCLGYDFDIASNGQEAVNLAIAKEGEYDICLMDVDMPVMNGCEATREIRKVTKYFPIMAVSGNVKIKNIYSDIGMDDFLMKPYLVESLYEKIKKLTVKVEKIYFKNNELYVKKEMPMDKKHAEELRELAKRDLWRVKFFDGPGNSLIVHKNVTNKISHDFNIKRQLMTSFINRDPDMPTRCELYKESNYLMPQTYLTEEECSNLIDTENAELEKFPEPFFKNVEDK